MKHTDLTSLDRATTSLTLRIIKSSTCTSHFSTAPLASDVEMCWISWTRSPSPLNIAWARRVCNSIQVHQPSCHLTITVCVTDLPGYPDWAGSPVWKYPQSTSSGGAALAVGLWSQTESPAFHHWIRRRTCQQHW